LLHEICIGLNPVNIFVIHEFVATYILYVVAHVIALRLLTNASLSINVAHVSTGLAGLVIKLFSVVYHYPLLFFANALK
jgi:hypothetical protein